MSASPASLVLSLSDSVDADFDTYRERLVLAFNDSDTSALQEGDLWHVVPTAWLDALTTDVGLVLLPQARAMLGPIDFAAAFDAAGHRRVQVTAAPAAAWAMLVAEFAVRGVPVMRRVVVQHGTAVLEIDPPEFSVHAMAGGRVPDRVVCSQLDSVGALVTAATGGRPGRVWVVPGEGVLLSVVTVAEFGAFPAKRLLQRLAYHQALRDVGLFKGRLVVEFASGGYPTAVFGTPATESSGCIGLVNLGNTCYMNLALQCLVHIPELNYYFKTGVYAAELNRENPLGYGGALAEAFGGLIKQLYGPRREFPKAYAPRPFKQAVGHANAMFEGYRQHDSQEFVAFLLDGLHEDLNRIDKKPYMEKPELARGEENDPAAVARLADTVWHQHRARNDSVVTDLFTGLYKSTLVCPECGKVSVTFDPYADLTLPLPVEQTWGKRIRVLPWDVARGWCEVEVEVPKRTAVEELKLELGKLTRTDARSLYFFSLYGRSIHPVTEEYVGAIPTSEAIVAYEIPHTASDVVVPVYLQVGLHAFGLPFFIVLSPEDALSFGTIRLKLEEAYLRLTTYHYFHAVRKNTQGKRYTPRDFGESDLALDSDVSLANPNIAGNYAFEIGVGGTGTGDFGDVWVPKTVGVRTGKPLLNMLSLRKRRYYSYDAGGSEDEYVVVSDGQQGERHSESDNGDSKPVTVSPPGAEEAAAEPVSLVQPHQHLTCTWTKVSFDAFFTGLDEEGGNETWLKPEAMPNPALERKRSTPPRDITLADCLRLFSAPEVLSVSDSWYCSDCKQFRQATKTLELHRVPDILTIQLKRFEGQGRTSSKISELVAFPTEGLDMSVYVTGEEGPLVYDLCGVDNHFGSLGSGHYTAHVRNFFDSKWYYFDDGRVRETKVEESVSLAAYLLFYRRRGSKCLGGEELEQRIGRGMGEYVRTWKEGRERDEMVVEAGRIWDAETAEEEAEEARGTELLPDVHEVSSEGTPETVDSQESE